MRTTIAIVALCAALDAHAATAYWTGRQEMVQTVTFQSGWRCQYQYAGQFFWRVFVGSSCPGSVEVQ